MVAFEPRRAGTGDKGIKRIFATSLTEILTFDAEGVGTIRREGNKTYKFIKFNNGTVNTEGLAGHFVVYFTDVGYDNSEVTFDNSDGSVGAGVLVAALQDGNFGWIQIGGQVILLISLDGGADGDAATLVAATDGTLTLSALVTDQHCGVINDVTAKKVVLTCPF